ncbi:MAG: hypothetical protein IPI30_22375 [Saprospiraceae bacterium]|nr:hypothetical protein [Candidatus Vicinibacter affinis]
MVLLFTEVFGQNIEFSHCPVMASSELNKNRAPLSYMWGVGVAYYNTESLDPNNPASLGFLKS